MSDTPAPIDPEMAAELAEALAPDGEHVDPFVELAIPDGDDFDGEAPPRPRWRVDTEERADYALRRVALEDEAIARVRALYDRQREQLDAWLAGRLKPHEQARTFFLGSAVDFARRLREADPTFRTLPLPCGWKLTAHDGRDGVDVLDAEAFVAWALEQEHDDVVKVDTKPVLAAIAKRYRVEAGRFVSGDGDEREVVPGIAFRPKGWTPDAKPPTPAKATPTVDTDAAEV